jgi:DNA-binding transcriptional ArsR family regulator
MSRTPKGTVELTDPRALRALAHPTRLELVGLLRQEGPLTATQAGERIGESPSSCSFHLRQLAKWGLVEEAGGGRGRERPWQATARYTSWSASHSEAATALSTIIVERYYADLFGWLERMPDEAPEWREAHQLGDVVVHLTPDELREVGRRIWDLLTAFDPERRPAGSRPVRLFYAGFPRDDA